MNINKDDELITEINVTPLVDIILVILIIFLLVAQIVGPQVLKVKLPEASHGEIDKKPVTIYIDKDGKYYLEGAQITEEDIKKHVKKWLTVDLETAFVVSADERINHGKVVRMLDLLRGEGARKLAIHVQRK